MELKANVPSGPVAEKWSKHRFDMKLVNPANKRKYNVIVVGSGLAGGAAAASMAELGYNVKVFCYQDSPRRAHSIAAQGGINAALQRMEDGLYGICSSCEEPIGEKRLDAFPETDRCIRCAT